MPRLVVLSEGFTGRAYDLKVDRTTVGRVDDNAFSIPEASVSSHHCEIILRGNDVVVRDLNSTNGTFVNGERVSEAVLKPGQVLRLGQLEMRLENGTAAPTGKKIDQTLVIPQGVKLGGAEHVPKGPPLGDTTLFQRKSNRTNVIFFVIVGVAILLILVLLGYALLKFRS
jgi:hypothetical protein